jgi:cytochrome P450
MLKSRFVPPRPPPPKTPPQGFALLRALRTNVLQIWPEEAYRGAVQQQGFLGRTLITINDAAAIHHVLVDNDTGYRRSPIRVRLLRPAVGEGLLLSEGRAWKLQRRTAAPAFSPRAVPLLSRHIAASVQEALAAMPRGPHRLDLLALVHRWAVEISARAMFSLDLGPLSIELRRLSTLYVQGLGRPYLLDALLPLSIPSPTDFARRRFSNTWMGLLEQMIATRLDASPNGTERDLLDLLRLARDPETGEGFSRTNLRDQVATMIVAGNETSSVAMFWSLYLLASVPDVQAQVAEEARALDLSPETVADALPRLTYTRAVFSEALRLYPPAFMLVREATQADDCGIAKIPKGATVLIAPWLLQRHRELWEDPDAFNPARFLPGVPAPSRFTYLPFGTGPRTCVGAQFATAMATITIASLVARYHITLKDQAPVMPVCVTVTTPDIAPRFCLSPR